MPDDLKLEIAFNRANYVGAAIKEVYKTLVIAFLVVFNNLSIFRKSKGCNSSCCCTSSKSNSFFFGLYLFDLSINIFVLLSFILAIGIITDDSVIMTDAIYRRIENGETPLVAAYKGSKQITFFAIVATTLILIAVFLPLIFIDGIAGTLFRETAIALSFSIVISSFVALTLSPMLGSKFLKKTPKQNYFITKFGGFLIRFLKIYQETLLFWLNKKKL